MATVTVGSDFESKTLHMNVLCHQSKFFKSKYEQHEYASGVSKLSLKNVKVSAFQDWTACAYGNSFAVSLIDVDKAYQLYYLSSDLKSPNLQDTAMDAIRKAYRDEGQWPSQRRIKTTYQNTRSDSPVRRFLTECVYFRVVKEKINANNYFGGDDFPREFVRDYVGMNQEMIQLAEHLFDPRFKEGCEFHMHAAADLCNA